MNLHSAESQQALDSISRHCPDALFAFIQCINRCNYKGEIFFSKKMVETELSESWAKFKNRIKKLAREDLLEWHYIDDGIFVTLAGDYDE